MEPPFGRYSPSIWRDFAMRQPRYMNGLCYQLVTIGPSMVTNGCRPDGLALVDLGAVGRGRAAKNGGGAAPRRTQGDRFSSTMAWPFGPFTRNRISPAGSWGATSAGHRRLRPPHGTGIEQKLARMIGLFSERPQPGEVLNPW